jgi:hypothetical protein
LHRGYSVRWRGYCVRVADRVFVGFAEVNSVVKDASVLIFAFANHEQNVMPDGAFFYPIDVGLAFENLLLAATDLGLVTHPMSAVGQSELKKVLGVPDGERFIIATPLAYPARAPMMRRLGNDALPARVRASRRSSTSTGGVSPSDHFLWQVVQDSDLLGQAAGDHQRRR